MKIYGHKNCFGKEKRNRLMKRMKNTQKKKQSSYTSSPSNNGISQISISFFSNNFASTFGLLLDESFDVDLSYGKS
jgi:hypothetical protein